jgi:hypothetical protein
MMVVMGRKEKITSSELIKQMFLFKEGEYAKWYFMIILPDCNFCIYVPLFP